MATENNKPATPTGSDLQKRRTASQVMELQQLIAGPLIATIEADALSTGKYLDTLFQFAFERDKETDKLNLRTLSFSYTDTDDTGRRVSREVKIPVLTLIPLPLLHIEEADFDFDIKILDALSEKIVDDFSIKDGEVEKLDEKSQLRFNANAFKMRASLAPHSGSRTGELQQSLAANMKVRVKMRQTDMPAGLANMLHLTSSNVQMSDTEVIPPSEEKTTDNKTKEEAANEQ